MVGNKSRCGTEPEALDSGCCEPMFEMLDIRMMNFKKWITYQLITKKLLSARPFTFFDEEAPTEELHSRGAIESALMAGPIPVNGPHSSNTQVTEFPAGPHLLTAETSHLTQQNYGNKNADKLNKVDELQINFLRFIHRIGLSPENPVVSQVLYRLHLGSLIGAGESDIKRSGLKVSKARAVAAEQEAAGQPSLDFSLKILVLGRTGVGKSATINSIFDQPKAATSAYHPATDDIQEVVGTIKGIKVSVIDTPGLTTSSSSPRKNRKVLLAVRNYIRKSPPDVVLYFERFDVINRHYSDFPLLKLVTDVFGPSIWFNTILVMTHASSPLPEGPDGYPVDFDAFVHRITFVVHHYVRQAVSNEKLEIPVVLVENHLLCRKNSKGEKVLPNGQAWLPQFLLLCMATKVLKDANALLKFQKNFQLTPSSNRPPSFPHLLSSILRPSTLVNADSSDNNVDEDWYNDEDDYDQLPPIRILTKSQFLKLSNAQKNAYLDELYYRETLYLKKQWKEEIKRRREHMDSVADTHANGPDYDDNASQESMQLSDVAIPVSFASDSPAYRYRCLLANDQWLVRPVLDPQGWDHDVGFDGINLEASHDVRRNLRASLAGQMRKDKDDFSVQSGLVARYTVENNRSLLAQVDIQSAGKDLICTIHNDAEFHNFKHNTTKCGLSVTKFNNMYIFGGRLEDSISVSRRCKLMVNGGQIRGCGQIASGGTLEATVMGRDYPARDDKMILAASLICFEKDMVIGGSLSSDFRVGRHSKMSIGANLNSRTLGQISLKASTTEHVEIALIAVISLVQGLFRRKTN